MTGDVCRDSCRNGFHAVYSGGCRANTEDSRNSCPRAHNPQKFIIFFGQLWVKSSLS